MTGQGRTKLAFAETRGQVMGTSFHVVVVDGPTGRELEVATRLRELEQRWSRFVLSSEISILNRRPDLFHLVSADTALLLERAVLGWELTNGIFDPTVLPAVIANGYDDSFENMASRPIPILSQPPLSAFGCESITIERCADDVALARLGEGVGFDPGGIGKGLAADIIVEEIMSSGAAGAMANIGGDLVCRGRAPSGDGWVVDIVEPSVTVGRIALLALADGAVATSTTRKRRWQMGDEPRHHVVDPSTGCSTSGPLLATVVAADGWYAEVMATQLLVGDVGQFDTASAAAIVIDELGNERVLGDLEVFLR